MTRTKWELERGAVWYFLKVDNNNKKKISIVFLISVCIEEIFGMFLLLFLSCLNGWHILYCLLCSEKQVMRNGSAHPAYTAIHFN